MTRPRDSCGGKSFRDAEPSDWQPRPGDDPVDLARAWAHYRLARRVLSALDSGDLTIQRLADALGVTYEDQRRKINGDQPLKDKDVALWNLVTSPDHKPLGDYGGLLPPGTSTLAGDWQPGQWVPTLSAGPSVLTVDVADVLGDLLKRVAQAQKTGIVDCIDTGALRFLAVESLSAIGISAGQIHADVGTGAVTLGTPEQLVLHLLSLPAAMAYDGESRLAALGETGSAILDLSARTAPRRYLLTLGHSRTLASVEAVLPAIVDGTKQTISIGPFEGFDSRWRTQVVDVSPLSVHHLGELSLRVLEIGKARQVS